MPSQAGGGRELLRRLPAQELDAHDGQHRERDDHQHLAEVVDRGREGQPEQEEDGGDRVDRDPMVAQIWREEAPYRNGVAAGSRHEPAADERQPNHEDEQRPLTQRVGNDLPDRSDRGLDRLGTGHRVHDRIAYQAPRRQDEQRRRQDPAPTAISASRRHPFAR